MVMLLNMVRAKFLAVILGPGGTGLIGLLMSSSQLITTVSSLGLTSSAVRQISKAQSEGDLSEISATITVYRLLIFSTSLIGFLFTLIFSEQICIWTFGNLDYLFETRCLSFLILMNGLTAGNTSLLQGMRKVKDIAVAKIVGTFMGAAVSICAIVFLKEKGIILFILINSIIVFLITYRISRKIKVLKLNIDFAIFRVQTKRLLKMGSAFLVSGFVTSFTAYYSRSVLSDSFSIETIGLYTAAWTLSAMYVDFVLSAMGIDFYPRLSAVIEEREKSVQLINDQLIAGVVISSIGISAIIVFAKLFLTLFYSPLFVESAILLQWMALGMALKVIVWPLGYVIISKGKSRLFVLSEVVWALTYLILLKLGLKIFGLKGAGIAFFATYLIYGLLVLFLATKLIFFKFSANAKISIAVFGGTLITLFFLEYFSNRNIIRITQILIFIIFSIWSIFNILKNIDLRQILFLKLFSKFNFKKRNERV